MLRKYKFKSKNSASYWLRKTDKGYTAVHEGELSDQAYGVDLIWDKEPEEDMNDKLVFPNSSGRLITGSPVNDLEYNKERAIVKGIDIKPVSIDKIGNTKI